MFNKLWCESTTNPVPVVRIAASRSFTELTKNVIRSSHGHSTPSLKISCNTTMAVRLSRNALVAINKLGLLYARPGE